MARRTNEQKLGHYIGNRGLGVQAVSSNLQLCSILNLCMKATYGAVMCVLFADVLFMSTWNATFVASSCCDNCFNQFVYSVSG